MQHWRGRSGAPLALFALALLLAAAARPAGALAAGDPPAAALRAGAAAAAAAERSFTIDQDQFVRDGQPMQLISGSMHYFRIHPAYWGDRLDRAAAMGLNAIEAYVPWNLHEPYPGEYTWTGFADVELFLQLAQDRGLLVVLRPGPYICAEWDFGGFPWWLASPKVAGGRTMKLRTSDPTYTAHVDRWWATLFSKLRRFLYRAGGPIVMVQIENEYGFCGSDKVYLRHLVDLARTHLGEDVLLFTTDPPGQAEAGSLEGDEIYTAVDFGPGWFNPDWAYSTQRRLNAPGKSPPFCSEFYTGWLSHWGEKMANTSTSVLIDDTRTLLEYANSTGSLSFYMAHGGTNFGFWAGANVDANTYMPHITSYDYDCPISEAGDYCQPGIGGDCKYQGLRDLIASHTRRKLPEPPPRPKAEAHGKVHLGKRVGLFEALPQLFSGGGIRVEQPDTMEEYGQRWGLILYRTLLPTGALGGEGAELDVGTPVHDYASVYLDGELVGRLDRSSGDTKLQLPAQGTPGAAAKGGAKGQGRVLDILVEAVGRQNFGCADYGWDLKGLTSPDVKLGGSTLRGWRVFPLQLDSVASLGYEGPLHAAPGHGSPSSEASDDTSGAATATARRLLDAAGWASGGATRLQFGAGGEGDIGDKAVPRFYRGTLEVGSTGGGDGAKHTADTFLSTHGWGKGVAWVNGFNLGWYWASRGPQMTLYVPGPVLRAGKNEVVLLELEASDARGTVEFLDLPDFYGPEGPQRSALAVAAVPPGRRRRVP